MITAKEARAIYLKSNKLHEKIMEEIGRYIHYASINGDNFVIIHIAARKPKKTNYDKVIIVEDYQSLKIGEDLFKLGYKFISAAKQYEVEHWYEEYTISW
jgi:hypothetical protein